MTPKKFPSELERTTIYNLNGDDEGGGMITSKWSCRSFFPPCGFEGQKGRGHISLPYGKESEQGAGALTRKQLSLNQHCH